MTHPGPNIRLLRNQLGLSLRAVAEATGIERGNLSRIESGKAGYSHDSLERIAKVLHVSIGVLMSDHEMVEGAALRMRQVPVLTLAQLAEWTGPESLDFEEDQRFLHTDLQRAGRFSFALAVADGANLPMLQPGHELIFDANRQPAEGSFVVLQIGKDEFLIGRYRTTRVPSQDDPGEYLVAPMNNLYPTVRSGDRQEFRLRGTAVEARDYFLG